jgi:O-antigen/teichoic acid export membrane protein
MIKKEQNFIAIIKSTSLYGGVQFINIIIQIVRTKILTILLGPFGFGLISFFNATIGLISEISSFSLVKVGVQKISKFYELNDKKNFYVYLVALKRAIFITGVLGTLLLIFFSSYISNLFFGNGLYTFPLIYVSISIFLNQISSGQLAILQSMRMHNYLASANLTGALLGFIISIPIYFLFGVNGIVPSIIFLSLANMLRSWHYSKKVKFAEYDLSKINTYGLGVNMMKLGFFFSISTLITTSIQYLLKIYITKSGGTIQLGLFDSGFTIINGYIGILFSSMTTDYFPRLSAVSDDENESTLMVNQQALTGILILAPILLIFSVFIKYLILLIYTKEFLKMIPMMEFAIIGIYFKVISWAIAFIFIAKGKSKLYFWNEILANIYFIIVNVCFYKYFSLKGLGYAYVIVNFLYFIQVLFISKRKFNFIIEKKVLFIFSIQILLMILYLVISKTFVIGFEFLLIFGIVLIMASMFISLFELNKIFPIKSLIIKVRSKWR